MLTALQLSVALATPRFAIITPQEVAPAPVYAMIGAGAVIVGGVLSVTSKKTSKKLDLPLPSAAVTRTGLWPRAAEVPAAGLWVSVTEPQLSLTTTPAVKSGTKA